MKKKSTISPSELIEFLKIELNELPDKRKGKNKKYQIKEAFLAAFSVFFTQCPSFLEHQSFMKQKKGKDNAESLFGLKEIPCDNQIRTLLDPIPAKTIFKTFKTAEEWLEENQVINQFKYLDNQLLIAMDGTEYYSSKKINCPQCNCRNHRNGQKTYYHQVITPVIVSPQKKQVINLEPEFIKKQDGKTKQDCENAAMKRWLLRNPNENEKKEITLLGDDLYSRQPICELTLKQGYNFIFVALASSHQTLYEWLDFLDKSGKIMRGEKKRYEKGKARIYRYKYINNVPLRESEPSLRVNWFEVEVIDVEKNQVIYKNSFITNHELKKEKMLKIIIAGRTRWKVENENNNTLKNQGYNLEHNFGHGQENLSEILLSLNLLSFLYHNILELVNVDYQFIREKLRTLKTFFNNLRALLTYIWFVSWEDLWVFMLTDGDERKLINSS